MRDWDETDFAKSTAGFRTLYTNITERLRECGHGLSLEHQPWLEFLIVGFERRFVGWRTDPTVRAYLEKIEQKVFKKPILRLIGHAYLHIAYDLPIVIADSLEGRTPHFKERGHYIYRSLSPEFGAVFIQCGNNREIVGYYGLLNQIGMFFAPRLVESIMVIVSNWAITLRSEAWMTARVLNACEQTQQRRDLERELWKLIHEKADMVFTMSSSPTEWMRFLVAPILPTFPDVQFDTQVGEVPKRGGPHLSKSDEDRPSDFV